jgi:mono/diheme cytochrome c family protein
MKPLASSCLILTALLALSLPLRSAEPVVDYNRDIRPILAKNCFACHGQDESHRAAKLRLDRRDTALLPRKRGAAIVPGAAEKSLLMKRVRTEDESKRMPPVQTGNALTSQQIATLARWIAQGAPYAAHWAFVKPERPPLPLVRSHVPRGNEIDAFVQAELAKHNLKPAAEADRYTLLRRLSFDLRGLPPTPREIEEFLHDRSPNAYEKAVDRFLNDPAYGERWARMWLDLARYADSAGYGSDPLRPNIWRWRDWVIDAFNRNLPYDQFSTEQLAGDLLPHPTLQQRLATAFHRNTMTNSEGGTDDEEFRVAAVKDRVDTTMQVWMGLTMGCAKCHSHKYDPITQQEYYRFYAFFNQTADNDQPDEQPTLPVPTAQQQEQNRRIDAQIAVRKAQWAAPPLVAVRALRRTPIPVESLALLGAIAKLEKSRPAVPKVPVMVELPPNKRRQTYLMVKGNFQNRGDKVEAGVPAAFHPLPKGAPANRLGMAKWLFDANNPLTARVAVNRYWAALFGSGLVETEEDFGTQGDMPSHPQLLDWLATEYVRLAWDTKALLKLLVTSATYRQSSQTTPEKLAKDPRNRLLSRGPRFRLEAEMVRDQALALSGLLSRKMHGPSVYPPQPPNLWQAAFNGQRTWATSQGEDRYRRGLYTFWRRTVPYPSMAAFDATSRETCTLRRIRTNTPLQAFVTLNDPVYVECAQALARRIVKEGGTTTEERARFGLRLCLCRPPRTEQVQQVMELFQTERDHYRKDADAALALATEPLGPLPAGMDAAELAAWVVVANVLLNLDAVMMKG